MIRNNPSMAVTSKHHYKDIDYSLKKSERKTTSIYIERDGSVSVLAPKPFNMLRIEALLEKKRSWIYRSLAEWEDLNRTRVTREYVNGESFLYFGRSYRLQIHKKQDKPLKLKNGQFCLNQSALGHAPKYFRDFYRSKLRPRVIARASVYSARMGIEPTEIKVQELKNRWGSCSSSGVIHIHWKCAMLSLSVLDYVVAHELVHLKYPNHTPAFWRLLEKILPGHDEQKNWLKFNGAGMTL
jgi:predicted metal-dependent hydrolase